MKTQLFNLLLILSSVLLQFSCTSQMQISTTKPAEVPIAYDQWKVVVVNRFNPALLPFEREKKVDVFTKGANEALMGAVDAIMYDSTYYLVHLDTAQYIAQQQNEPLSPEQVREIYQLYPHHLLLSLDHFDAFLDRETVSEKSSDGSVSKTTYFTLVTKAYFTLFDSTGTVLDQVSMKQEELYQSRMVLSGLLAIGPDMGKAGPAVNKLAWYAGHFYWGRLSSQPVTYVRHYYSMKKFEKAAQLMAAQDWEAAISILQPIAESDKKESAKAAYNLAVVYEASGNVQQARYWATKALHKNDQLALQLLHDLDRYWSGK